MTWTGQTFSVGQTLTAAQMANLQNDITALANADSGAPQIKPSSALNDAITTEGRQSIAAGARWTPSQGIYNFASETSTGAGNLELYISAAWRTKSGSASGSTTIVDGTNMRLYNFAAAAYYTNWQRFDG